MLIDGKLSAAADGAEFDNLSPATGRVLGRTAAAGPADMDRAIAAAQKGVRRHRLVHQPRTAQALPAPAAVGARSRKGRPARRTRRRGRLPGDVDRRAPAGVAAGRVAALPEPADRRIRLGANAGRRRAVRRAQRAHRRQGAGRCRRRHHPVELPGRGHPQQTRSRAGHRQHRHPQTRSATRRGTPPASAGSSPSTPTSPPGVLNVVPTPSNEVAGLLATDPRVDMVSFTGSTAVGKQLMRDGADTMKRTFLELGGKSALIVLDDANPAHVIGGAVGVCVHAGQACALTTRLVIHESLYPEALAAITAAYQAVPVGDPALPGTFVGPVVSADAEAARARRLRAGASRWRRDPDRRGQFRRPAGLSGGWPLRAAHGDRRCRQQRPRSPSRRSSDRSWWCCRSATTTRPSASPTTASTGLPVRCCRGRSNGA